MRGLLTLVCLFTAGMLRLSASVITFEGAGLINVNPSTPYSEAGFTLIPSSGASAILPFGYLQGDSTLALLFDATNTITLTGPTPFNLEGALIGHSVYPYGAGDVNVTVVGNVLGVGIITRTFNGLTTALQVDIGFTNLRSATFSASGRALGTPTAAGLDNISVDTTVPEPSSLMLSGTSLLLALMWVAYDSRSQSSHQHITPHGRQQ